MFLIKLFQRRPHVDDLLSEQEFRQRIDEERMRVDRNGSIFSLVVFRCDRPNCARRSRDLSTVCTNRVRMIDQSGFLSNREIGLLLPGTDAAGAEKVSGDIMELMQESSEDFRKTVYVYPDGDLPASVDSEAVQTHIHSADELLVEPLPMWKRMLDICGATVGTVITMPIMIVAAIAIKLDSPGPVLFTQDRSGLGGRPFKIYKFRTMTNGADEQKHALRANSEQDGPAFKIKADPRVTRVGRYLRRTCIDEFPQFINVLKGDMSLVGPRPLPCDESEECEGWQRRRLSVTPGLTCIWQVSGGMSIPFVEWMRMDIRYIRSRRPLHDLKLLWATFIAIVFHRASH